MDENFFKGYRKTALKPEDVLVSILIPFTEKVILVTHNKYCYFIAFYYMCSRSYIY